MDANPVPLPANLFDRVDKTPDAHFYGVPRLVTHIDDATIDALTDYYRETLPAGGDILDVMSSWVSHFPGEMEFGRVAVLGMNEQELAANPRATETFVHDLNADPELPYEAESFDAARRDAGGAPPQPSDPQHECENEAQGAASDSALHERLRGFQR